MKKISKIIKIIWGLSLMIMSYAPSQSSNFLAQSVVAQSYVLPLAILSLLGMFGGLLIVRDAVLVDLMDERIRTLEAKQ